jgi:hypothetical protein
VCRGRPEEAGDDFSLTGRDERGTVLKEYILCGVSHRVGRDFPIPRSGEKPLEMVELGSRRTFETGVDLQAV